MTQGLIRAIYTRKNKTRLKKRRELYHLYEHVLSKTRTARINGSRLVRVSFLFLTRFHVNVVRSNSNPTWRAKN